MTFLIQNTGEVGEPVGTHAHRPTCTRTLTHARTGTLVHTHRKKSQANKGARNCVQGHDRPTGAETESDGGARVGGGQLRPLPGGGQIT